RSGRRPGSSASSYTQDSLYDGKMGPGWAPESQRVQRDLRPQGESGRRVTNMTVSLIRVVRRGHLRSCRPPRAVCAIREPSRVRFGCAPPVRRRNILGGTILVGHRTVAGGRKARRPALAAALVGLVLAGAGLVPAIAANQ